jgi:TRAP-type C4-dicarboxylate transport system permease large subunit
LPLVVNAGFDPYWFAAVMMVNLQIGLLTPPVALNLRVVRALAPEVSVATAFKGALPFILCMGLGIVALYLAPEIATWLPDQLMGPSVRTGY